jgi:hypothetical protein
MVDGPEYVIRAADRVEWPAIPAHRLEEVLVPAGYGAQRVPGDGFLRLWLGTAFSGEEVGWQVWFEADTTGLDPDLDPFDGAGGPPDSGHRRTRLRPRIRGDA